MKFEYIWKIYLKQSMIFNEVGYHIFNLTFDKKIGNLLALIAEEILLIQLSIYRSSRRKVIHLQKFHFVYYYTNRTWCILQKKKMS